MKKIIAVVLSLVMIFSFAVPSFAVTADEQSTSLKSGWGSTSSIPSYPSGYSSSWFYLILYHTYQIRTSLNNIDSDTGNMLIQLRNIATDISSIELDVSSIESDVDTIRENSVSIISGINNVISYVDELESSLSTTNNTLSSILTDTDMLQKVLADEDDLALKKSQKQNQEFIEDTFFTPGSDLSLDLDKLGSLVDLSTSFSDSFDFSAYGSGSPISNLGEGSEFMSWFTTETGLDMDPDFSGGSGGGDFPWPDNPDNPDNPDEPDPLPETTPTPTISYNDSTFTVSASGNGDIKLYVGGSQVSNPYTFIQTYDIQTFVVTATAQETDKLISDTARLDVTVPAKQRETTPTPTISYNDSTFTVSASGNGVLKLYVDGSQVSNPYTFTQTDSSVTYVVTATAQETDKLISDTARLDVTVPALVPDEPDPVPETTPTPTITYNDSTFTVSASGNGDIKLYVGGSQVSNPYTFTQTYDIQTFVVTATAQETDKLISDTARLDVTVPAKQRETTPTPTISYNDSTFTVSASGNGVVKLYVGGSEKSNPYTFTQTSEQQTFVVTATAQETDKLISDTARLDVTVPALVPDTPVVNWLPLATASPGGSSIYGGVGYRPDYYWDWYYEEPTYYDEGSGVVSLSGWIPVSPGDTVYMYRVSLFSGDPDIDDDNYYRNIATYYGSSYDWDYLLDDVDSNGVFSYKIPSGVSYVRFTVHQFTSSSVITVNEYPNISSTYSLRRGFSSQKSATSFYQNRQNVFNFLLRGGK